MPELPVSVEHPVQLVPTRAFNSQEAVAVLIGHRLFHALPATDRDVVGVEHVVPVRDPV